MPKPTLRVLALALVALVGSAISRASTCATPTADVTTLGSCSVGPLVFSNWTFQDALGNGGGPIALTSAYLLGSAVYLQFAPAALATTATSPSVKDLHLLFEVSGFVGGVNLNNAGTPGSVIQEIACSTNPTIVGACPSTNVLWNVQANGGVWQPGPSGSAYYVFDPSQSSVWIWKDLNAPAYNSSTQTGQSISSFTQGFLVSEPVPEPASISLVGAGLMALGLFRGRRAKK